MSWKQLSDQEIVKVKFYQAVLVGDVSSCISLRVNKEVSAQLPKLISMERGEFSLLITVTSQAGLTTYTEVPYNNVAYINYVKAPEVALKPAKASTK